MPAADVAYPGIRQIQARVRKLSREDFERFRLIELTAGRHLRAELTRPGHPHILHATSLAR